MSNLLEEYGSFLRTQQNNLVLAASSGNTAKAGDIFSKILKTFKQKIVEDIQKTVKQTMKTEGKDIFKKHLMAHGDETADIADSHHSVHIKGYDAHIIELKEAYDKSLADMKTMYEAERTANTNCETQLSKEKERCEVEVAEIEEELQKIKRKLSKCETPRAASPCAIRCFLNISLPSVFIVCLTVF